MTVESELSVSGPYDGNDTTTIFPYQFLILNEGDLEVVHSDANGLETILEISTHYTVSGVNDPLGGNVTYPASGDPLPAGEKLIVRRKVDALQEVQLSTQGGYSPKTVETMLDRITMVAQQLKSDLARCISVSAFSDSTPDDLLQSINQNALIATEKAVEATEKAAEAAVSATIFGGLSRKNQLLGNFRINQRGVSGTVVLAPGEYGHDRFRAGASGCTYTFSTAGNITTVDISAGSLEQEVEGANLLPGDYVLSWVGTAQGRVNSGVYGDSGQVVESLAGGTNTVVEFGVGTVALPQLEKGTEDTEFELRQIGDELALCKRFYQKLLFQHRGYEQSGYTTKGCVGLPVSLREAASVTYSETINQGSVEAPSFSAEGQTLQYSLNTATSNTTIWWGGDVYLDSEL